MTQCIAEQGTVAQSTEKQDAEKQNAEKQNAVTQNRGANAYSSDSACGAANSRNWNLPLSLKSQSSNSSS